MKLNQMMMMVVMDGNGGGEYGTDGKQPQVPQPKQLTVLFPERRSLKLSRAVHGDLRRLKLRHLTSFTLVKKSLLRSQMAKASRAKKDGTFFAGPGHGAGPIHQRNRWDCEVWMILWITGWWFQPLWKIWKSVEMIIPNIWKNKKIQTTNQFCNSGGIQLAPWSYGWGHEEATDWQTERDFRRLSTVLPAAIFVWGIHTYISIHV